MQANTTTNTVKFQSELGGLVRAWFPPHEPHLDEAKKEADRCRGWVATTRVADSGFRADV
jgi:hypothetical protein